MYKGDTPSHLSIKITLKRLSVPVSWGSARYALRFRSYLCHAMVVLSCDEGCRVSG